MATYEQPLLPQLTDLFNAQPTVMNTFAELDHYGSRPEHEYLGPINVLPGSKPMEWPTGRKGRIFAYLRPSVPGVDALLDALAACGASVICAMPGMNPAHNRWHASARMLITPEPVAAEPLMRSADLVVNYGASGTMAQALLAGVPQLMVPANVEQYLGAVRVESLGAGRMVRLERKQAHFGRTIAELLAEPGYRRNTQAFADKYSAFDSNQAADKTVKIIEAVATGHRGKPLNPSHAIPS